MGLDAAGLSIKMPDAIEIQRIRDEVRSVIKAYGRGEDCILSDVKIWYGCYVSY